MSEISLGKIEQVSLRTIWKNEAYDFTRWLTQPQNLALLSDEVGVSLKVIETEVNVGSFKTDILAEDEQGRKAIIENQLEETNHDHLGKIITYAAGKDAKIIIWIVNEVRDEHKQAVDWLNEHTDDELNFFLIKMELWRIASSPPAPKLLVISKPNEWTKAIREQGNEPSETKLLQLQFWNKFKQYAIDHGTSLRMRKPLPQHWYNSPVGSSAAHLAFTVNTQEGRVGCELYIPEEKELFKWLSLHKQEIEKELGEAPEWMDLPNKKASRIRITMVADLGIESKWNEYFAWLKDQGERFRAVFEKNIERAQIE
jgi:hypothetical protein